MKKRSALERLLDKVEIDEETGCWLWTAVLNVNGYGAFRYEGRTCGAHRVAYKLIVGLVPDDLQVDHLCRTRRCVNPDHLELVTFAENIDRRICANSVKTHCPQGHLYDEQNMYYAPDRSRNCRECNRVAVRRYRDKRRAATLMEEGVA